MGKKSSLHFDSRVIHEGLNPDEWQGATLPPIFQSASTLHKTAESLSNTFAGKEKNHIYMRLTNPTNSAFEDKVASLENGKGAVVMSSGMAAVTNTCMTLLKSGDEFIAGSSLFMSTYLLFTGVFKKYNLNARIVDIKNTKEIEKKMLKKPELKLKKRKLPCVLKKDYLSFKAILIRKYWIIQTKALIIAS